MARISEILFVDPSVSDLETILRNLRPGVHAVVLDERRPAAQQIAAALEGREGLDAVHIIAHGAPGRVAFTTGEWSIATLDRDSHHLAAIGRALADDGDLRLWSCKTGFGASGQTFVEGLEEATGTCVAAATARVGAAARGGVWQLKSSATDVAPPINAMGVQAYSGLLDFDLTINGTIGNSGSGTVNTFFVVDSTTNTIVATLQIPSKANTPAFSKLLIRRPGCKFDRHLRSIYLQHVERQFHFGCYAQPRIQWGNKRWRHLHKRVNKQ